MPVAAAYTEFIPDDHREALGLAIEILTDQFFEDVGNVTADRGRVAFADTTMADFLPTIYSDRYDAGFATRFLVALVVVGTKLTEREPLLLTCVAEELALNALVVEATDLLRSRGRAADFSGFRDAAFEDEDFDYLFDASQDGIEESEVGTYMGMTSLRFDDWFKPFRDTDPVHPWLAATANEDLPSWFRDAEP
jgi:hypothetical protein